MSSRYPPEPWQLRGNLHSSVFVVPLAEVPVELPPDCQAVRFGRHAVLATAWVSYQPGGVLAYNELMATLLVRRGWRLLVTITHIWVDSPASRDGGRALWGIPKQLATFEFAAPQFAAHDDDGPIAAGATAPSRSVPARLPCRFRIVQRFGGSARVTPVRAKARFALCRASFEADPDGPLAFLAGRRPLVSGSLLDFRMTFGRG